MDYILKQLKNLLSIDSPTGFTKNLADYLMEEYSKMGYHPQKTVKGGVLVDLGGQDSDDAVLLAAHGDTLGAMVTEIKPNGCLSVSPLGGLNPNNTETENCRIITRFGGTYEGTCQLCNASIHVNGKYSETARTFESVEILLDEKVFSKAETQSLGIMPGDIVCFDPRTVFTKSGYIKSRFLDDKLSSAILMGYAKYLADEHIVPKRRVYQHFTVYEEVGHGNSASLPSGVTEVLAVDMGCVGDGLGCQEHQVSICAKDSGGPYNYDLVTDLIQTARENHLDFAVDVYPHYGSDAETPLRSGHDVRHGLIGPGVYASHGYERSHVDGVKNTFLLLKGYLG